jgi:hypothetical protein
MTYIDENWDKLVWKRKTVLLKLPWL